MIVSISVKFPGTPGILQDYVTIIEMEDLVGFKGINWLNAINARLPNWIQLNKNDTIMVKNIQHINQAMDFIDKIDKR